MHPNGEIEGQDRECIPQLAMTKLAQASFQPRSQLVCYLLPATFRAFPSSSPFTFVPPFTAQ